MDYSHILRNSVPQENKLLSMGFWKVDSGYEYKIEIPESEFYTKINITAEKISAQVFEVETDERYALFDMPSANGAFIGELRDKVNQIILDIQKNCFVVEEIKDMYLQYLEDTFEISPDFPWQGDTASVFRCQNQKWFALVMEVSFKSLGFASEERVWVVNLKTDPELIPILVDNKSVFPAYHMNKKYWITVLLTAVTDFEKLKALTEESYYLVDKKK